MKPKLVALQFHPAPYRDAIFKKICERSLIDLQVLNMSEVDYGHTYRPRSALGYPTHYLGKAIRFKYLGFFHYKIFHELLSCGYDVYLTHFGSITGIIVALYAWMRSKPIILTSDSVLFPPLQKGRFIKIRHWCLRKIFQKTAAVWVAGKASQEYSEYFGFPKDQIFQGAYCLDIDLILQMVASAKIRRREIRAKLKVKDYQYLFLFVGRMLPFRGVKYLLSAFHLLKQSCPDVNLLLIGDGPERADNEAMAKYLGLSDVIFLDPVPMDELTNYYVAADAYVTPALRENYSLALAQAAICGLPMVSTDRVGAIKDYLTDGETGFLVPAGDSRALAQAMTRLVLNKDLARRMGLQASKLAKRRTLNWAATQLEYAVFQAVRISKDKTVTKN